MVRIGPVLRLAHDSPRGRRELDDYLGFLKSGCSKFPLELLKDAGVDMTRPEPIQATLVYFDQLVDELDDLLGSL